MNVKRARSLVALAVFVAVGVGLAFHAGTGTISSMGVQWVASVCPLGSLEALFGEHALVARLVIALFVMVALCLFLGKAFCAWACPVPHVRNLFRTRRRQRMEAEARAEASQCALARWRDGGKEARFTPDGRHVVLGGALATAAVFGFPVFCLVCPIGLTVGEFVLLWRFVQFNEATWALVAFPAIVLAEVVVFGRWCESLCPLGALLSLIATGNRTLRPTVDRSACLRDVQGQPCQACGLACPEHIDPHSNLGQRPLSECVRCGNCSSACPVSAITFPFLEKGERDDGGEEEG